LRFEWKWFLKWRRLRLDRRWIARQVRVNEKYSKKTYRLLFGAMTSVFVLAGATGVSAET